MNKFISIIVPVYNCENTIEKCINSVLNQSYSNFELILVNDGSTDSSEEICERYSKKNKKIILINQSNGGVSNARNNGIKISTGDLVLFIDSDDFLDKNSLEEMVKVYTPRCMIKLNYFIINKGEKIYKKFNSYSSDEFKNMIIKGDIDAYIWGTLFEKKIINKIFFDEDICYLEDLIFQLEYLKSIDEVIYVGKNNSSYNYVINNDSITSNNKNFKKKISSVYNSLCIVDKSNNYKYNSFISKRFERILFIELCKTNNIKELKLACNYVKSNEYNLLIKNKLFLLTFKYNLYWLLFLCIKSRNIMKNVFFILNSIKITDTLKELKKYISYLIFNFLYIFYRKNRISIINDIDIVNDIVNNKKSICRFGDGELKWVLKIKQNSFQDSNEDLSKRLRKILEYDAYYNSNLIIGMPEGINHIYDYNNEAKIYWKRFCVKHGSKIFKIIPNINFANTNITRPYMDYRDKSYDVVKQRFDNIKKIWNKRDVIIIEGEFTRLGVGNDLFDNTSSIKRIICPSKNAFEVIDDIENLIAKMSKEYLFLVSLGPTATVIVSDMSKFGYQLIDIGHIDVEYSWFRTGSLKKEKIQGKYVNEAGGIDDTNLIDNIYEKQIIGKVI